MSEQLGVGIKVEAASSEQASEVGKASDKKVCLNIFSDCDCLHTIVCSGAEYFSVCVFRCRLS